uniref:DUF1618 domain-containing protein n=1 Tax=Aegilops tauschii TaxID=37682 RepID=M8C6S7_AEGTA
MAPPAWIILGADTRVSEQQDADLSLELAAPPRVSVLNVPRRVSPVQADPTSGVCPWVVSAGKFRCAEWSSRSDDEAPMTVSMWTLSDPEANEWVLDYKVSFQEIWADDSYRAAGLTEKNPTFALVHPMNPDVLYFFLEEHLFGVDLRAKRVVECGVYEMVVPPSGKPPNCFSVRALELPIALSADIHLFKLMF